MTSHHESEFTGDESALVQNCLDSIFVSSVGNYVDQIEALLADYPKARNFCSLPSDYGSHGGFRRELAKIIA